ncbi:unnamed protein product [Amoebophrya sp. A120]|nr:unnamed protein product [Amoebophrya sp. A120]|eukprot:GSA120T00015912001.1
MLRHTTLLLQALSMVVINTFTSPSTARAAGMKLFLSPGGIIVQHLVQQHGTGLLLFPQEFLWTSAAARLSRPGRASSSSSLAGDDASIVEVDEVDGQEEEQNRQPRFRGAERLPKQGGKSEKLTASTRLKRTTSSNTIVHGAPSELHLEEKTVASTTSTSRNAPFSSSTEDLLRSSSFVALRENYKNAVAKTRKKVAEKKNKREKEKTKMENVFPDCYGSSGHGDHEDHDDKEEEPLTGGMGSKKALVDAPKNNNKPAAVPPAPAAAAQEISRADEDENRDANAEPSDLGSRSYKVGPADHTSLRFPPGTYGDPEVFGNKYGASAPDDAAAAPDEEVEVDVGNTKTSTRKTASDAEIEEQCPWMSHSGQSRFLLCMDDTLQSVGRHFRYHDACNHHGGRKKCPEDQPIMCQKDNDCANERDHCCKHSPGECELSHHHGPMQHGGPRECPVMAKEAFLARLQEMSVPLTHSHPGMNR